MRSYIFDAIFAGIHICFSGFFAAYGKSYIGFAHNVLAVALIRVPGAWLLSNAYSDTLFPMGIASPCGSILSAVICVVAFTVLNRRGAFDKLAA
jgi:Na+-driven multidrug efflux pump